MPGRGRKWLVLAALAGAALANAAPAFADGQLEIVGQPKVAISAFTDAPDSFVGSVTVHASGGDVSFTAVASDLVAQDGTTLDRSHVTLLGATTVPQGTYQVETIKVSGVSNPGDYTGTVTLAAGGQMLEVAVTVAAKEHPAVALPAGGQLKLSVTRCGGWFSCWVAGSLMPDGGKDATTSVLLTNSGKAPDTITAAQVFATGTVGGHTLTTPLGWKGDIAAGGVEPLTLTVTRAQVPPDHYTGSAYVSVKDGSNFLTVPVDITVRSGPLWAILALLFGIVIGRLAVHMNTKGNRQASELWRLYGLRADAERRLADPLDRAALTQPLAAAASAINSFDLDAAGTQLTEIATAIDLLAHAHDLEVTLGALPDPPAGAPAIVDSLRNAIRDQDYDGATKHLGELQALVLQAQAAAQAAAAAGVVAEGEAPAAQIEAQFRGAQAASMHLDALALGVGQLTSARARQAADAALNTGRQWLRRGGQWLRSLVEWLAGTEPAATAEARLWLIRPLLTLVLIALLVGLGLKTLYVSNATFGSGGFVDYFALIVWGLSADVAARTLTSLGGAPAAAAPLPGN